MAFGTPTGGAGGAEGAPVGDTMECEPDRVRFPPDEPVAADLSTFWLFRGGTAAPAFRNNDVDVDVDVDIASEATLLARPRDAL